MAKIQREKVVIEGLSYNFEKRYEQAMEQFDDKKVISVSLIASKEDGDSIREEYLVFFEELPEEEEVEDSDACLIEAGDLIYWINERAEISYETVEKVVFEDGTNKCYFLEGDYSDGGWMPRNQMILVAKKKDRKDV